MYCGRRPFRAPAHTMATYPRRGTKPTLQGPALFVKRGYPLSPTRLPSAIEPADDVAVVAAKVLSGLCASEASKQRARSILNALCVLSLPPQSTQSQPWQLTSVRAARSHK